ncbi:GerMN domain-containing protein [Kineococcus sp. TBRC 1896]|uniref:GerMN domain-containing protein n=1 Tax=Kineococcus mangrovi TaxID=1660183 RepID=A0ABV4HYE4_9ACTN
MNGRRRAGGGVHAGALLTCLLTGLAACGVPSDGQVQTIDPTRIPYALASPAPTPTPTPDPPRSTAPGPVRVYLLDADLRLTGLPLTEAPASTSEAVALVLRRLQRGPTDDDRATGLQSALGADVELDVSDATDGVVTVEVQGLSEDQSADRLPLAVGQVVLSLTSVPGVTGVRLQRGGSDREVPLPGGALTDEVLTGADYASLLAPPEQTP